MVVDCVIMWESEECKEASQSVQSVCGMGRRNIGTEGKREAQGTLAAGENSLVPRLQGCLPFGRARRGERGTYRCTSVPQHENFGSKRRSRRHLSPFGFDDETFGRYLDGQLHLANLGTTSQQASTGPAKPSQYKAQYRV